VVELDDVDRKILELLTKDSRASFTEMARILELSEGTVRRRVQSLVRSGIIKRFTIEAWNEKPKALVLISVAPSIPTFEIAERISRIRGVMFLFEVAGPYDITLVIHGEDIAAINQSIEEIRSLDGVQQTNTLFVLKEW